MKSFAEFMTEAAFLMRKTGENLVTHKNKKGRAGFPGRPDEHKKIQVGGELGSSNPTRHAKAFGNLKKLMREPMKAKDAVKHLSKHVDHAPMFDNISDIAKDKPETDVRPLVKDHLRKAGLKNTHLL